MPAHSLLPLAFDCGVKGMTLRLLVRLCSLTHCYSLVLREVGCRIRGLVARGPLTHGSLNTAVFSLILTVGWSDPTGSGTAVPPHSFPILLYSRVLMEFTAVVNCMMLRDLVPRCPPTHVSLSILLYSLVFDCGVEGMTLRPLVRLCPLSHCSLPILRYSRF